MTPSRPDEARWAVHGSRSVYESWFVELCLVDVELPSGRRFEHEAVRVPRDAVGTAVVVDDRLLMIWRHRMIPDTWGWEIPAGLIDPGESVAEAAHREVVEETGWEPGPTTHALTWHPSSGLSDQRFHLHTATAAAHVGEPSDLDEALEVAWIPLDRLPGLIAEGGLVDGMSIVGVLHWLARRGLAP